MEYGLYRLDKRADEIKRLLQVLKETFERRYPADTAVEAAIEKLRAEVDMLSLDIQQRSK